MRKVVQDDNQSSRAPLYRAPLAVNEVAEIMLNNMLIDLHATDADKLAFIDDLLSMAADTDINRYEDSAKNLANRLGLIEALPLLLRNRAEVIYAQIMPHLPSKRASILDYGCGNGVVGTMVSDSTILADVYEHPNIRNLDHPFYLLTDGEPSPFEDYSFDCILLLTVLHHSDFPDRIISDAARILKPGGTVIVIESVYGITSNTKPEYQNPGSSEFISLTSADQKKLNILFDHFYNRVLYDGVNCPFNFDTPSGWKARFGNHGLQETERRYLGVDQPVVPEFHTLHVLRKP